MKLMSDLTSMEVMEVERIKVKEDPDWGSSVPKHEPIDELYLDHEVKHDLVLGPELLLREQQPLVSHTFEVTVKIEEAESHEVKIEKYNEDTEADFVGVRATYSDSKLQCRGIDTNAYHWTKKDILSIQNCFVRIERMTLFKEQYTCKICKKIFSQKAILTKHLSSHEEPNNRQKRIRKTATDEVDTAARVRDVSLIKQAVNNTEKPYQCSRCEKNFKLRVLLQNHMRIHTGEKPYVCKTCDRRFTELSNLKRHERIHTGEKPFSCQICKKQFSLKINLRDHINIHTKKRPYVCILCSKDFRDLSTFTRHKLIHSEKKITCDICRKKFTRKYHLKRHMESHNKK